MLPARKARRFPFAVALAGAAADVRGGERAAAGKEIKPIIKYICVLSKNQLIFSQIDNFISVSFDNKNRPLKILYIKMQLGQSRP